MSKLYPTPHINATPDDFAKTVLMPGDPLRAKFIAENFLSDARLVNNVRGIRNEVDMQYEENMLDFNKKFYPEIKNIYINCDEGMKTISSTAFKAVLSDENKWSEFLTEEVAKVLLKAL